MDNLILIKPLQFKDRLFKKCSNSPFLTQMIKHDGAKKTNWNYGRICFTYGKTEMWKISEDVIE